MQQVYQEIVSYLYNKANNLPNTFSDINAYVAKSKIWSEITNENPDLNVIQFDTALEFLTQNTVIEAKRFSSSELSYRITSKGVSLLLSSSNEDENNESRGRKSRGRIGLV